MSRIRNQTKKWGFECCEPDQRLLLIKGENVCYKIYFVHGGGYVFLLIFITKKRGYECCEPDSRLLPMKGENVCEKRAWVLWAQDLNPLWNQTKNRGSGCCEPDQTTPDQRLLPMKGENVYEKGENIGVQKKRKKKNTKKCEKLDLSPMGV